MKRVSVPAFIDQLVKTKISFNKLLSNIHNEKPLAFITKGDFNARTRNWCSLDITNSRGSISDTLTSTYGYHQLKICKLICQKEFLHYSLNFNFKPKSHCRIRY